MDPEMFQKWSAFEEEARKVLNSEAGLPLLRGIGIRRELLLCEQPSFADTQLIQLLACDSGQRASPSRFILTRCRWDQAADRKDFATPISWLRRIGEPAVPTLHRAFRQVPDEQALGWLAALQSCALPLRPDAIFGLDGVSLA